MSDISTRMPIKQRPEVTRLSFKPKQKPLLSVHSSVKPKSSCCCLPCFSDKLSEPSFHSAKTIRFPVFHIILSVQTFYLSGYSLLIQGFDNRFHHLFCITKQHHGVVTEEKFIFNTGIARSHATFEKKNCSRFFYLKNGHTVNRR